MLLKSGEDKPFAKNYEPNAQEFEVIKAIAAFPDAVSEAAEKYEPFEYNRLNHYIFSGTPIPSSASAFLSVYLDKFGFDFVVGQTDGVPLKPDPYTTLKLIEEFGVKKSECVFVGDGETDVQTAARANIVSHHRAKYNIICKILTRNWQNLVIYASHSTIEKGNFPVLKQGNLAVLQRTVAIVHNGIIENYIQLRKKMTARGYQFLSETDTEVLPLPVISVGSAF